MLNELIAKHCIKHGEFKLKNGDISNHYFDIKNIISTPFLLRKVGDELYNLLGDFDIICGIPFGGLPIATYISTKYDKPLIFVRDKQKNYGTQKLIEGTFNKTDKCVIIDDVITTGNSIIETYNVLKDKVNIVEIGVVLDRQTNNPISINNTKLNALFYKSDFSVAI